MAGKILLPPAYETDLEGPLIFTAGPIQGAADWQSEAITLISSLAPEVHIASPRRPAERKGDFDKAKYEEQVDWEHFHLTRSGRDGVILFWLAREHEHSCDRAYAQTTRFECGEAVAYHYLVGHKVVVGIEDGFPGGRYIRYSLGKKYPNIPITDSLDETCARAAELARSESA